MKIKVNYEVDFKTKYEAVTREKRYESEELFYAAEPGVNESERLKLLERAVNLDPFNGHAKMELVKIQYEGQELITELIKVIKDEELYLDVIEGITVENSFGHFWMMIETRPYMRMNYNLYEAYIEVGEFNKAIKILETLFNLDSSDSMGIRYILHKELLRAGKYNKLRTFFDKQYYYWCEESGIPYSFDKYQCYSMLATSARYKTPNNFKEYLSLIGDEDISYILNSNKDGVSTEFIDFIEYTNQEFDNLGLIREYYKSIK